jgi:O-antigen/teichoic acid export membrane protein
MWQLLKQKRLLNDAVWALSGQLWSALALLIGTRLLTEQVSPEVFGQVALLNGFVALGVGVFSYPFICAGMRLLPECRNQAERNALQYAVFGLTARSTTLAVVLLMAAGGLYVVTNDVAMGLMVLTGLLLAVTVRRELGIQLLIGERKQRSASLWQTTDSLLRPLLAIGLVLWLDADAGAVLLGYIIASVLSNTLWAIVHTEESQPHKNSTHVTEFKRQIWRYALPLLPMELIFWLNGLGDRYVIGFMLSAAEVGVYAAAYLLINEAFNRSAMVLLRIFQPTYFQAFTEGNSQQAFAVLKLWSLSVLAMGCLGVALVCLGKSWVADVLLAKTYADAAVLMPAIALGSALNALGTVLAQPLLAQKRPQKVLKGRLCGTLVLLISLPLLVLEHGLPGAALANPVYYGIEALVLALLAKPWRRLQAYPVAIFSIPLN